MRCDMRVVQSIGKLEWNWLICNLRQNSLTSGYGSKLSFQPCKFGHVQCWTFRFGRFKPYSSMVLCTPKKSAHTALAVKACLLGGNSYTKCSITFVIVAVAISALAGGAKNGFAPRPEFGGVFDIFRGFLGVWAQEGIEMEFWVILVAFRQWKNGQKWKKHCT